jgi:hypothetical protein
MKRTIFVVAKEKRVCPRENPSEPMITDSEPVPVQLTNYYQRLLRDGSIREVEAKEPAQKKESKK